MTDLPMHLSVHREIEAIKEAVALKAIDACAAWLCEHDHDDLAEALLADLIEPESGEAPK